MVRLSAILILVLVCFANCKKKKIISNAVYAIGVVDFYEPQGKFGSRISFDFYDDSKPYSGNYQNNYNGWNVPSNGDYKKGDKYMVEYDDSNPKVARFLFDYVVNDSTDYIKWINRFKTNPPQ